MDRDAYPQLQSPSEDGHTGALTFDMLRDALSPETMRREEQRRERRLEQATTIREDVWRKCLDFHKGDETAARELYFKVEMEAYLRSGFARFEDEPL